MKEKNILLHASEHYFLLSSSETLMLRNYSRVKHFNYCSQIGGSESIRDIQEAKNIDADAFEFQIVESLFSISKIIQALQKTYSDYLEDLATKYIFINISNQESLNLIKDLNTYKLPEFLKETKIILNYDRRALIKSLYKLENNDFEVFQYESNINKLIFDSHKEIINSPFLISISGGITYESLENLFKTKISFNFIKTGFFSIKTNHKNIIDLKKYLIHYQSLEAKLINIMGNSINNKSSYLEKRKIHLTNFLMDLLN
tara:strand:+ start:3250 stop:4026 length:777 start_codon:yes stop_codon:yes gene_type:complete